MGFSTKREKRRKEESKQANYETIGLFFLAKLLHQFIFLPFLSRKKEKEGK